VDCLSTARRVRPLEPGLVVRSARAAWPGFRRVSVPVPVPVPVRPPWVPALRALSSLTPTSDPGAAPS